MDRLVGVKSDPVDRLVALLDKPAEPPTSESVTIFENCYKALLKRNRGIVYLPLCSVLSAWLEDIQNRKNEMKAALI